MFITHNYHGDGIFRIKRLGGKKGAGLGWAHDTLVMNNYIATLKVAR